ncbi:MAG: hypothetical protein IIC58_14275 [Proteobacteria bacterium]|nr:hypothetical protein [Pseudomonadota bacterium]
MPEKWDSEVSDSQIAKFRNNHVRHFENVWVWSKQPYADAFIDCHLAYKEQAASAFLDQVARGSYNTTGTQAVFFGNILAYEFIHQDSALTKRRHSEKASLSRLRSDFENTRNTLYGEVDNYKSNYEEWDTGTRDKAARLYEIEVKLGKRLARRQKKKFRNQLEDWKSEIRNLEKTYEQLLKLKKPAEYWNIRAGKLRAQGNLWLLLLVLNYGGITEEREQLVYLYLALVNEEKMDSESLPLVLQAIFSRSDSGLMGKDLTPQMPATTDFASRITGQAK